MVHHRLLYVISLAVAASLRRRDQTKIQMPVVLPSGEAAQKLQAHNATEEWKDLNVAFGVPEWFCDSSVLFSTNSANVVAKQRTGDEIKIWNGSFILASLSVPKEMLVMYVGDAYGVRGEGFYFPVLRQTPVILVRRGFKYEDVHIILTLGDGDMFEIRFPSRFPGGKPKINELIDLLQPRSHCFDVQIDKWVDVIHKTGDNLVDGVTVTKTKASALIKQGAEAIKGRAPNETKDVNVPYGVKAGVKAAFVVTDLANNVTSTVINGAVSFVRKRVNKTITRYSKAKQVWKHVKSTWLPKNSTQAKKESATSQRLKALRTQGGNIVTVGAEALQGLLNQATNDSTEALAAHIGDKAAVEVGDTVSAGLKTALNVYELSNLVTAKKVGKVLAQRAATGVIVDVAGRKKELSSQADNVTDPDTLRLAAKAFKYTAMGLQGRLAY